jgi:hypothetical protein
VDDWTSRCICFHCDRDWRLPTCLIPSQCPRLCRSTRIVCAGIANVHLFVGTCFSNKSRRRSQWMSERASSRVTSLACWWPSRTPSATLQPNPFQRPHLPSSKIRLPTVKGPQVCASLSSLQTCQLSISTQTKIDLSLFLSIFIFIYIYTHVSGPQRGGWQPLFVRAAEVGWEVWAAQAH